MITVEVVDKLSHILEKQMEQGLDQYGISHDITVDYKKFSFIFRYEQKVIGILNAFHSYNCIHIEDLWVDNVYRGKGYGKQLIENLVEHFKGKGFDNINCITCDYQAPDFYRKCGFTEEFVRINNKNPKFTMTFFIKFFD